MISNNLQDNWSETTDSIRELHDHLDLKLLSKEAAFPLCEKKLESTANRLHVLKVVHRRVSNQLNKFYLYMGMDLAPAREQKV
jgi:hypothetical protein